jgi:hypothetical protein
MTPSPGTENGSFVPPSGNRRSTLRPDTSRAISRSLSRSVGIRTGVDRTPRTASRQPRIALFRVCLQPAWLLPSDAVEPDLRSPRLVGLVRLRMQDPMTPTAPRSVPEALPGTRPRQTARRRGTQTLQRAPRDRSCPRRLATKRRGRPPGGTLLRGHRPAEQLPPGEGGQAQPVHQDSEDDREDILGTKSGFPEVTESAGEERGARGVASDRV